MAASIQTLADIAATIERHVPAGDIRPLMDDLLKVDGNASFRASILALDRLFARRGI